MAHLRPECTHLLTIKRNRTNSCASQIPSDKLSKQHALPILLPLTGIHDPGQFLHSAVGPGSDRIKRHLVQPTEWVLWFNAAELLVTALIKDKTPDEPVDILSTEIYSDR